MGGSPVGDGTLSLDGFNTSAAALVKRWKEIEVDDFLPDWTWKPCSKMGAPSEVSAQCFFFSLLLYPPLLALQFALGLVHLLTDLLVFLQVEGYLALEGVYRGCGGSQVCSSLPVCL